MCCKLCRYQHVKMYVVINVCGHVCLDQRVKMYVMIDMWKYMSWITCGNVCHDLHGKCIS